MKPNFLNNIASIVTIFVFISGLESLSFFVDKENDGLFNVDFGEGKSFALILFSLIVFYAVMYRIFLGIVRATFGYSNNKGSRVDITNSGVVVLGIVLIILSQFFPVYLAEVFWGTPWNEENYNLLYYYLLTLGLSTGVFVVVVKVLAKQGEMYEW